jgi:hypothetical protein
MVPDTVVPDRGEVIDTVGWLDVEFFTVKMAAAPVTLPAGLLTTITNVDPLSVIAAEGVV